MPTSPQSHFFRTVARLSSRYTDRLLARSLADLQRMALSGPRVPRGVTIESVQANGVPCEWLDSPTVGTDGAGTHARPVILYLHGGGWILGWGNVHRRLAARIGREAGARVLAVDYRLAPEHPFPAALEDCVSAYRWLLDQGVAPARIAVAGDSAGGNLTVTTLLALRDAGLPLPAVAVCISPAADLSGDSHHDAAREDVLLSHSTGRFMAQAYVGGQDPRHPLISPVFADLHGLPPMLIQVGGDESLLEGAQRLAERASAAGVDVTLEVWPGMWHVWHAFGPYLPEARQAVAHIADFMRVRWRRMAIGV